MDLEFHRGNQFKMYQRDRSIPTASRGHQNWEGTRFPWQLVLFLRWGTKSKAVPLAFDSGMWQTYFANWVRPTTASASVRLRRMISAKVHSSIFW